MIARVKDFIIANALIVVAVLLGLLTFQTIRIDGLRIDLPLIGMIGPKGLIAENDDLATANKKLLAQRDAARAESQRIAKANTAATEKADADETAELAAEMPASERFIAAGGVRRCPAPRTDAPASGQGSGVDEGGSALPVMDDLPEVVTVLPEDVRICTENTVKARAWQQWGLSIEANSGVKSDE
jgi:hypothetical protein